MPTLIFPWWALAHPAPHAGAPASSPLVLHPRGGLAGTLSMLPLVEFPVLGIFHYLSHSLCVMLSACKVRNSRVLDGFAVRIMQNMT